MDPQTAIALLVLFFASYLLPTFIASCRGHHNTLAIFVLNLTLGWTILGFCAALVCAALGARVVYAEARLHNDPFGRPGLSTP